MSLWHIAVPTVGYNWVTVMDGVKFEFNDIKLIVCIKYNNIGSLKV